MLFFFFNVTPTPEIYTLSLHDALPICGPRDDLSRRGEPVPLAHHVLARVHAAHQLAAPPPRLRLVRHERDRKSTRLNSSHTVISYAVFCLKKKKNKIINYIHKHHVPCS